MTGIFLLLGTNLGDRHKNLIRAKQLLLEAGIDVLASSSIYETQPWGKEDQPWFLNVLLEVRTSFTPEVLLLKCQDVEEELGRTRFEKWGERTIDVDILYYFDQVVNTRKLTIPHPEIQNRKFTLLPLVELAAFVNHPVLNQSHMALLGACEDPLEVKKTKLTLG
ncbi:MAG: 2-amino-4-hydroxy-6-hydroxymethyldihydropteridine diphosphokinase [Cytophagales bacterium]|nr:2-amino-4-hydroxy-6-hydroxymethyldihydropteridine diphosphokinase [Cytophagales bacterium]